MSSLDTLPVTVRAVVDGEVATFDCRDIPEALSHFRRLRKKASAVYAISVAGEVLSRADLSNELVALTGSDGVPPRRPRRSENPRR